VDPKRDRPLELGRQARAVGVIDVDDRGGWWLPAREQQALGVEVLPHRREVEVILGQVGEHRRGEMDRIGPPKLQRMR